jgi:two-component system NtrC family sensor kinase
MDNQAVLSEQFPILDHLPQGICILRPDWSIVFWNACLEEWTGLRKSDALGCQIGQLYPKLSEPQYTSRLELLFSGGPPVSFSPQFHPHFFPCSLPDGRTRVQRTMAKAVNYPEYYAMLVIEDVTPLDRQVRESQRLRQETLKEMAERKKLTKQLIDTSRRVGMADMATGVLHNVGNVLNSVNVAAGVVADTVRRSSLDKVSQTAELIEEHLQDIKNYLIKDPKGQQIPGYLIKLGQKLIQEQDTVVKELKELLTNIEHIKEIISVQQTVAKSSSMEEPVALADLMDQALSVNQASLEKWQVEVIRDYMTMPEVVVDKHQMLQVLVNLISNAKHAMKGMSGRPRVLTLRIVQFEENNSGWVQLEVDDRGVGISPEHMNRIFSQGFTTKKDGHGFGLHSGAISAKLMGGSLTVKSEGTGYGATFTLTVPAKRREVLV